MVSPPGLVTARSASAIHSCMSVVNPRTRTRRRARAARRSSRRRRASLRPATITTWAAPTEASRARTRPSTGPVPKPPPSTSRSGEAALRRRASPRGYPRSRASANAGWIGMPRNAACVSARARPRPGGGRGCRPGPRSSDRRPGQRQKRCTSKSVTTTACGTRCRAPARALGEPGSPRAGSGCGRRRSGAKSAHGAATRRRVFRRSIEGRGRWLSAARLPRRPVVRS